MKSFNLALSGVAVAVASLLSAPANAVVVTFGGQSTNVVGGDQSGLTSIFVPVANVIDPFSGILIETFDYATRNTTLNGLVDAINGPAPAPGLYSSLGAIDITQPANSQGPGPCGINSFGAVSLTLGGSPATFGVQKGSNGFGAAPGGTNPSIGDSTCYGFGPGPQRPLPSGFNSTVRVDYSGLIPGLQALGIAAPGDSIGYLGIYYGSIDTYNDITFYSSGNTKVAGSGILADGVITGSEILGIMGGSSGNQSGAGSNVYVNLFFGPGETFSAFEFSTTGVAYELDNIVVGLASKNVPEPASLALVGLGLLGLAGARRRKSV